MLRKRFKNHMEHRKCVMENSHTVCHGHWAEWQRESHAAGSTLNCKISAKYACVNQYRHSQADDHVPRLQIYKWVLLPNTSRHRATLPELSQ
eukprot:scaffold76979_cov20-Prasinocladus_malaysianus.AAC.1